MPYTFHNITNPNPIDDIITYIFPGISFAFKHHEFLFSGSVIQHKLFLLAERLEFIHNLKILQKDIANSHKNEIIQQNNSDGSILCEERFKCTYLGEDFAGVHINIDALRVYLLITCIDTIASQPTNINPFEFITNYAKGNSLNEISLEDLGKLKDTYDESFALSKNFKKQFIEKLHSELQKKWVENFCVCTTRGYAVGKSIKDSKPGHIDKESLAAWSKKESTQKMKAISSTLYSMRSQFTHASIRHISPSLDVEKSLFAHKKHLVQLNELGLDVMLIATIRDLADRMTAEGSLTGDAATIYKQMGFTDTPTTLFLKEDVENEWWFRGLID